MRKLFRWLAVVAMLVTVLWWFLGGRNVGWTKTSAPIKTVEEATGLENVVWEKRFIPGVDFIGAGLLGGALLFGLSFCFRKHFPEGAQ